MWKKHLTWEMNQKWDDGVKVRKNLLKNVVKSYTDNRHCEVTVSLLKQFTSQIPFHWRKYIKQLFISNNWNMVDHTFDYNRFKRMTSELFLCSLHNVNCIKNEIVVAEKYEYISKNTASSPTPPPPPPKKTPFPLRNSLQYNQEQLSSSSWHLCFLNLHFNPS